MNLPEIKAKALSLYAMHLDNVSLREQVLQAYYKDLQVKFGDLFSEFRDKDYLISQFKDILSENWDLIRQTGLCYTAMPHNKVTVLMVGIAVYVANLEKEEHPLALLMPNVCLESCSDEFPDLNTEQFKSSESILSLLKTHILGFDSNYLIPLRLATHIEVNEELDQINNPYFNYQEHPADNAVISAEELSRLYKHSRTLKTLFAKKQNYTDVAQNDTHLLGQFQKLCERLRIASRYGNGSELHAGNEAYQGVIEFVSIYNQYFGKKIHLLTANPDDLSMLEQCYLWIANKKLFVVQHGALVQIPLTDKTGFKQTLQVLTSNTAPNSKELLLSVFDMMKLIESNSDHVCVPQIPAPLHKHLLKIIEFVTDPQSNHDATQSMQTCVHDLRQKLSAYVLQYQDILVSFTSGMDESINLQPLVQSYNEAKQELQYALEHGHYHLGYDDLQNYGDLIEPLGVDFEIAEISDLQLIKDYNQETIEGIFAHEQLRAQAVAVFQSLNELVEYLMELPVNLVETFVNETYTELCELHIPNLETLGNLIIVLDAERCAVILKAIAEIRLPQLKNFIELQDYLDIQPFHSACVSLKEHMLSSLSLEGFIEAIKTLRTQEKIRILKDSLLQSIPDLIESPSELFGIRIVVTEEEFRELGLKVKANISKNIDNAEDFTLCLSILDDAEQIQLFQDYQSKLISWAGDLETTKTIFMHCPNSLFQGLNEQFSDKIKKNIDSNQDWFSLYQNLCQAKQEVFLSNNKDHLFETVFKKPDSHIWKHVPGLANYYLSLKPHFLHLMASSNKCQAYDFMHSLIFSDEQSVKERYEKLIQKQANSRINFFQQLTQIDGIVGELVKMPSELIKKIFKALDLERPRLGEPHLLKQKLKEYITDKLDCKPCTKKMKISPFSR